MAVKDSLHFSLKDNKGVFKLEILKNQVFWIGFALKIALSFLFAGKFLKEAFIPFVTYFFQSGFSNPYEFFYSAGAAEAFPYPPFMLYYLGVLGGFASNLSPFFIRIPLLLADIGILLVLSRLLKGKATKILKYYWLSPVLIYITYIHGQLDVVPIAFLLVSSYLLFKKKNILSALVLGLGIAAKTNLVLVIPFYILYVWKNNNEKKLAKLAVPALITLLVFFVLNLPYIDSDAYLKMVYANREQPKIWNAGFSMMGTLNYYIIPSMYLILLATATRFKRISKDLFLIFIGFSFSVLLIFIPPQPGWYFWILPFFVYFAIRENKFTFLPILILQFAFLIYFALRVDSDYFSVFLFSESNYTLYRFIEENQLVPPDVLVSLALTFLQTCLLLNVYWIYKWGIKKNLEKKIKNKPFLIGIGGDSGVGKSTLTGLLTNIFGSDNMTIMRGDDMHRWERGHDKWNELTHLSPKANYLHEDIKHLKLLRSGKSISRRIYDHNTGKFTDPLKVYPNKIVIFEGLHPFYIEAKRELFDLKVFMDPEEDLRLHWKVNRDISRRGYSKDEIIDQLKFREEDSLKYIRSQAPFSDIKIRYYDQESSKEEGNKEVKLGLKIELETNIDINNFVEVVSGVGSLQLTHDYEMNYQTLDVKGQVSKSEIERLIYLIHDDYEDLFEGGILEENLKGFLQLFFIYCILHKAKNA